MKVGMPLKKYTIPGVSKQCGIVHFFSFYVVKLEDMKNNDWLNNEFYDI